MNICVFKPKFSVRICNIETFEGISGQEDDIIDCWGFTESGEPICDEGFYSKALYRIAGGFSSGIAINPMLRRRISGRIHTRTLSEVLEISEDRLKEIYEPIKSVRKLYWYREYQIHGMLAPYYKCSDKWMVSADKPIVKYDLWNEFLASIGSKWRIITPMINKAIIQLKMKTIFGEVKKE